VDPTRFSASGRDGRLEFETETPMTSADLRAMGAVNYLQPLPPSRYVRSRRTGEVFLWCEMFASMPEEFDNCDRSGDWRPEAWSGELPEGFEAGPAPPGRPSGPPAGARQGDPGVTIVGRPSYGGDDGGVLGLPKPAEAPPRKRARAPFVPPDAS
jgi:hypothetical protein